MKNPLNNEKIRLFWDKTRLFLAEAFLPSEKNDYKPEALDGPKLFWYGAVLLIVKIAFFSLILFLPFTNYFSTIVSQNLLALVNDARQAKNLTVLSFNAQLNSAAELKAEHMVANNYFDHFSPSGISPWYWFKKAGYKYDYAGENLALDFSDTKAVFDAWMASPTHRANILNPNFREIGLAVKQGELQNHQATLAVLEFGSQQTTKSAPIKAQPSIEIPKVAAAAPSKNPTTPKPATPAFSPAQPNPSVSPLVLSENITLKAANSASPLPSLEPTETPAAVSAPQSALVLGAFISKTDEVLKSLYLYFTIFLAAALVVNVLVKIRIQRWPTIFGSTLLIALSCALIFI